MEDGTLDETFWGFPFSLAELHSHWKYTLSSLFLVNVRTISSCYPTLMSIRLYTFHTNARPAKSLSSCPAVDMWKSCSLDSAWIQRASSSTSLPQSPASLDSRLARINSNLNLRSQSFLHLGGSRFPNSPRLLLLRRRTSSHSLCASSLHIRHDSGTST